MLTPEAALACCRFLHDAAAMLLWGASAFLAGLVPAGLARAVSLRLAPLGAAAAAVAVATTVAALPIEAAAIGTGWADGAEPATLRAILAETSVGSAWLVQIVAAAALAGTKLVPPCRRLPATAVTAGVLLASLASTGHAAMQEGWLGVLHRANDIAHVLAGGAWLGALVPLLPILSALDRPEARHDAGLALRRFSLAGHAAVALVVATGAANTTLTLGRWPTDWSSPYQALLSLKIAIVAAMTGLAVLNRYVVVPRLARHREFGLGVLRGATVVEVGLGLAAIACVSVFGLAEPT